jgi:hypothetical protein
MAQADAPLRSGANTKDRLPPGGVLSPTPPPV